jgi:hypothetical protein
MINALTFTIIIMMLDTFTAAATNFIGENDRNRVEDESLRPIYFTSLINLELWSCGNTEYLFSRVTMRQVYDV